MTAIELNLETLHLKHGAHKSAEDGMCAMEAVAFMAGEPFSDKPVCACPVISAFLRNWNDSLPDDERQQLKRYLPLVIGTRGAPEQESRRAWMAADWLVRVQTPAWLDLAGLTKQAAILRGMAEATAETAPSIKPAIEAARVDAAAAGGAARDAAGGAARDAARDAARAAAWDAARDAAWDAAGGRRRGRHMGRCKEETRADRCAAASLRARVGVADDRGEAMTAPDDFRKRLEALRERPEQKHGQSFTEFAAEQREVAKAALTFCEDMLRDCTPDMLVDGGPGMTLRDYFAAKALIGLIGEPVSGGFVATVFAMSGGKEFKGTEAGRYAFVSYELADAMLAERSKP